ncbi:YhgE/Pip domain-containing protein [Streptomyces sp. NPDC058459]|uniref:YhgE/Pip domain-containing protein n=1 Tax=Streptomyces sp. NPDC058459 TaxID=3346508 RepID=UPI00365985C5
MASGMPPPPSGRRVPASRLLGRWKLWLMPAVLSSLVALVLSLLYMGGILTPEGSLHRMPLALVNLDDGKPLPGRQLDVGTRAARSILSSGTSDGRVRWRPMSRAKAQDELASGEVYGALVIPADFTATVGALTTEDARSRPELTVLTNPGVGSLASSLASRITQDAAHRVSVSVGEQLSASPRVKRANAATRVLIADPVEVRTEVGHPIGAHSGLGLSAFYYALLLVLAGFIGGNIIHNGVDSGLGYADTEIGPWHSRRPTVRISRTRTLVVKMAMTAGLALLTTSLIMLATIGVLGMDAPHPGLLWVFSYCAVLTVGLGVQAINAAFGSLGQLVSMFVFIAFALPSSGATVPLEAVPGFYRFLGAFEPMRQLAAGVRAILYFDARADAGLRRGWVMIAVGFVVGLAFGFAATRYYDRRGLHRMVPRPA